MHIQFLKTNKEGQTPAGVASLYDTQVVFTGVAEVIVSELTKYGILLNGEVVKPQHGEKFLRALPFMYNGSAFRALLIE